MLMNQSLCPVFRQFLDFVAQPDVRRPALPPENLDAPPGDVAGETRPSALATASLPANLPA